MLRFLQLRMPINVQCFQGCVFNNKLTGHSQLWLLNLTRTKIKEWQVLQKALNLTRSTQLLPLSGAWKYLQSKPLRWNKKTSKKKKKKTLHATHTMIIIPWKWVALIPIKYWGGFHHSFIRQLRKVGVLARNPGSHAIETRYSGTQTKIFVRKLANTEKRRTWLTKATN